MQQLSTLWVFGCSYTNSYGISSTNSGRRYLGKTVNFFNSKYDHYSWSIQLGTQLNMNIENFSKGGASYEDILHWIVNVLYKIKEGDIVIIGQTFPMRLRYPLGQNMWANYLVDPSKADYDDPRLKFILEYLEPHTQQLINEQTEVLNNLCKLLNKNRCKTILFNWELWDVFETWNNWSANQIDDGHWSLNGNTDFAKYLFLILQKMKENGNVHHDATNKEQVKEGYKILTEELNFYTHSFLPYKTFKEVRLESDIRWYRGDEQEVFLNCLKIL